MTNQHFFRKKSNGVRLQRTTPVIRIIELIELLILQLFAMS